MVSWPVEDPLGFIVYVPPLKLGSDSLKAFSENASPNVPSLSRSTVKVTVDEAPASFITQLPEKLVV